MSDTELIKEKLDIVEFIKQYVPLAHAGKNWKGLCPFHKEKTPSFMVSPDRQSWRCFGCNEGGDIISFLMKYENIEFLEALKVLGERAGVDVRGSGQEQRRYAVLYDVTTAARDFFRNYLASDAAIAEAVRAYLCERGLKAETVEAFELGFAPNASDALTRHLSKLGFSITDIERAGLAFKTERGTYWDRFRHRIMFPIHNHFGKVVGFTGRIVPSASADTAAVTPPKYVNSPETPVYNKSRILFGFNLAKSGIREANTAVLVEGQMDLLMAWQDGVRNAIAVSGTALTKDHIKRLRRLAGTLTVAFDGDDAGRAATERAVDMAHELDFTVTVLDLPFALAAHADLSEIKDPADVVLARAGLFGELLNKSEAALRYFIRSHLDPIDRRDPGALKRGVRMVLSKIRTIASAVEQAFWLRELALATGIPEQHLADELALLPVSRVAVHPVTEHSSAYKTAIQLSRREIIIECLLGIAASDNICRVELANYLELFDDRYRSIAEHIVTGVATPLPSELSALLDRASFNASRFVQSDISPKEAFGDLVKQLRAEQYRDERVRIANRIRQAEADGNEQALHDALADFDRISREMYSS